jgi:hypothetical protein
MTAGAPGEPGDPAALAAEVVAALNERDHERLGRLLDDGSRVVTGRKAHEGIDAIQAWAAKEYSHLQRRFAIDAYRTIGARVLASGMVQYVWTEGGEVADSTPIALELSFAGGRLEELSIHDDVAAALAAFESQSP